MRIQVILDSSSLSPLLVFKGAAGKLTSASFEGPGYPNRPRCPKCSRPERTNGHSVAKEIKARASQNFRGPRVGGWIRRGWISRCWGAPIFSPEVPKYLFFKGLGTSGRKIGAPQKRQVQPRRIQPPILGPLRTEQAGLRSKSQTSFRNPALEAQNLPRSDHAL